MGYTEAQMRATAKYNKKNYDRIEIKVKKGEKEKIKQYTENKGKSLNMYIIELIEKDMKGSK